VSMATDEMIRLVTMFPEVFFMDTTAGECIWILIYYEFIVFVTYEFISSMNSYYSLHMNSYAFLKYDFLYCLNVQVLTGTEKNYLLWLWEHLEKGLSQVISLLSLQQKSGFFMQFSVYLFLGYMERGSVQWIVWYWRMRKTQSTGLLNL
jgi:hypothetical protein